MIKIYEKLNKYVILTYCDISLFGPKVSLTVDTKNPIIKVDYPLLIEVQKLQNKKIEKYQNNELLEENGSSLEPIASEFQEFSDLIIVQNEKEVIRKNLYIIYIIIYFILLFLILNFDI